MKDQIIMRFTPNSTSGLTIIILTDIGKEVGLYGEVPPRDTFGWRV